MTQTKRIVYGGRKGYDRAVERHKAKGWVIVSEEQKPAPRMRTIYIANLIRQQ